MVAKSYPNPDGKKMRSRAAAPLPHPLQHPMVDRLFGLVCVYIHVSHRDPLVAWPEVAPLLHPTFKWSDLSCEVNKPFSSRTPIQRLAERNWGTLHACLEHVEMLYESWDSARTWDLRILVLLSDLRCSSLSALTWLAKWIILFRQGTPHTLCMPGSESGDSQKSDILFTFATFHF